MKEQTAVPRPSMPTTWDELDSAPIMRVVDSIDLELALGCTEQLRDRVMALPHGERDDLRRMLQDKATATRVVDQHGQAHSVTLMAAPFVLGYTVESAVPVEPVLIRDDGTSSLASHWLKAWELMIPGARVIPATTCILVEEVLAASPDAVHACLQEGASFIQDKVRPRLKIGQDNFRDKWHSAGGAVAATYLALAYVIRPDGATDPNPHVSVGNMSSAAALLHAIFAARRGAPRVRVLPPAPFFEALRAAAAANVRHFAEWGDANDPHWTLAMIKPDACSSVSVVGSYSFANDSVEDTEKTLTIRWGWDRTWWTDDQLARFEREVDHFDCQTSKSRSFSRPGEVAVVGPSAGALH